MMKFPCSHCGQDISVPESYLGKRVRCAHCRGPVLVPSPHQTPQPMDSTIIKFRCPHCRQKIAVTQEYAGRRARCAKCRHLLSVPAPKQEPLHGRATADKSKGDHVIPKTIWIDGLLDVSKRPQSREPSVEDTLRLAPPAPATADKQLITCPQCRTPNSPDTEFCSACGLSFGGLAEGPTRGAASTALCAIGASAGLTFAGITACVLLAYLIGWFWTHFLVVGVAALAAYGLTLSTDERSPAMGLLAVLIGFIGIVLGKYAIARLVILPKADSFWRTESPLGESQVTDKQVDSIIKQPHATFMFACYHLAEEFGWDWEFTMKVTMVYMFSHYPSRGMPPLKMPPHELAELKQAVKKVSQTIVGWSEDEKRQAIRSGISKYKESFKESFRAAVEAIEESNEPGQPPPEFVRETFDIFTGDRPPSKTKIGRIFAMGGPCCCLDIILIPLGLLLAYVIAAGRR